MSGGADFPDEKSYQIIRLDECCSKENLLPPTTVLLSQTDRVPGSPVARSLAGSRYDPIRGTQLNQGKNQPVPVA